MACSKPLKIDSHLKRSRKSNQFETSVKISHNPLNNISDSYRQPFEFDALYKSNFHNNYYSVPCGRCLNCRVDKMNELSDRCEYEYINFGCGAFVTFTFDDYHINPYSFVNSKTGQVNATLSKKCLKDFLNRLNKLVHKYNKKYGLTPFCRPDYKYLCVGEYGENGQLFDRPH